MSRSARRHVRRNRGLPALSAYDAQILADSPVLYLPLSTTSAAPDYSGHGHHGVLFNNPSSTTFLNGDSAVTFNGVNQYVQVADHDDLSITTSGMLTLECWIRPDALEFNDEETSTAPYVYFAGKNTSNNSEYVCRMYSKKASWTDADWAAVGIPSPRPNRISGYANNLTGGFGQGSYFQDTVTAGEWMYYVLVINTVNVDTTYPTGYVSIYKNGVFRMKQPLKGQYDITPGNGTAPFRIGTATLNSFFEGAIAKMALYNYELSPASIFAHYSVIVPQPNGTAGFIKHIGHTSKTTTGTKLNLTIPAGGVSAGSTLLVSVAHLYTGTNPTMADNRGNVYTRDQSVVVSDGGSPATNLMRSSLFSAQVNAALEAGDVIQLTTSSVGARMMSVDEFTRITFSSPLDQLAIKSGRSTTPGTSNTLTTTNADDLIYGQVAVNGPTADSFTQDSVGLFTGLTRAGTNTGVANGDVVVNSAFKVVGTTGSYKYQPTLGTLRPWTSTMAGYKAGQPIITPIGNVGSAQYVGFVGSASAQTAGTTLTITIAGEGVAVNHTLIVRVLSDFSSGNPTITDGAGNTYTRDRSAPNSGNTMRASIFSARITTALQDGHTINITFASSVTTRVAQVDEFSNVLLPVAVDVQNGNGNSGTSPSTSVTTTFADDLIIGFVGVEGPTDDDFNPDVPHLWNPMLRIGTTGGATATADKTINSAYRSVSTTGTYIFSPTLDVSRNYLIFEVAYKASSTPPAPPPTGTAAFVKNIGTATANTAGTTLTVTVPSGGVASGHTLVVKVLSDYQTNSPTVADNRSGSNVYTLDRLGADSGHGIRGSIYSCPVSVALQAGDVITITFPSSLTTRVVTIDEFSGVLVPTAADGNNGRSGTSTAPNVTATTTNADDLLIGFVGAAGDVSDTFTEDTPNAWTSLTRAGTTGGTFANNRTLNSAYRAVGTAGTYSYQPTLATSSLWLALFIAYRAT